MNGAFLVNMILYGMAILIFVCVCGWMDESKR